MKFLKCSQFKREKAHCPLIKKEILMCCQMILFIMYVREEVGIKIHQTQ